MPSGGPLSLLSGWSGAETRGPRRRRAGALGALGAALALGGCMRTEVTEVEVPVARRTVVSAPAPERYTVVVLSRAEPAAVGVFAMQRCTWLSDERWQTVRTEERRARTWTLVVGSILALAGAGGLTEEDDDTLPMGVMLGGGLLVAIPLATASTEERRGPERRVVTPRGVAPCVYQPQAGVTVQVGQGAAAEVRVTDAHGTARFSAPVAPSTLLVGGRAPDGIFAR